MKILIVTTFPVSEPRHGGQHRVANMMACLRSAGHDVYLRGVLGSEQYLPSEGFVSYPGTSALNQFKSVPGLMDDWAIGRLFVEDEEYFEQLSAKIDIIPDLIISELPWLFAFCRKYRRSLGKDADIPLVYGSENIESRLKRSIVASYCSRKQGDECARLVDAVELDAIESADLIVSVSEEEAGWFREKAKVHVVVAPNGVADRRAAIQDMAKSGEITQGHKFALFCASAHPPNVDGFFSMFANGVCCISPSDRLVLAGAIGGTLKLDSRYNSIPGLYFRAIDAGEVEESVLRGLLATAHAIVLPITEGGGTNLKTAEAIWSGRHVVATTKAMRGFEQFLSASGVHIADDPAQFARKLHYAMQSPPVQISAYERKSRAVVLWEHCLASLVTALEEVKGVHCD
jgi:hypothetical protein